MSNDDENGSDSSRLITGLESGESASVRKKKVSLSVIKRLPRYYRYLTYIGENGIVRISSHELSQRMGLTASQIRQDFNCFGGFGQQGYGYNVEQLKNEIARILGVRNKSRAIIIGAGNLGRALAAHMDFDKCGFSLIGIFDRNEAIAGQIVNGIPVRHIDGLDDFCRANLPVVAALCLPREGAVEMVETLIPLGIKGFWNFSLHDFKNEYPGIEFENVHLNDALTTLCYKVSAGSGE